MDTRFARPLALLYATFGKGLEAVRLLDQSIRDNPTISRRCFAASNGCSTRIAPELVVHDRDEDLRLAHAYADGI